jgi:Domain of unknown function (DUF4190)
MSSSAVPIQRTCDRAVAALVVGIVGLVFIPVVAPVLALWLGISAKKQIRDDSSLTGEWMATVGIILGAIGVALSLLMLLVVVFIVAPVHSG